MSEQNGNRNRPSGSRPSGAHTSSSGGTRRPAQQRSGSQHSGQGERRRTTSQQGGKRNTNTRPNPNGNRPGGKKATKKQRKKRKVIIYVIEIIVLLILLLILGVWMKLNKIDRGTIKEEDLTINQLDSETQALLSGYTNIALFGLDNRSNGDFDTGRSDSIIVVSINNDTKEVRMVSIYRDTYLDMTTGKFNKANSAYSTGGPEQAIKMLNKNLDLTIEKYISVDFAAMTDAVDLLGGIDIDVDETEIDHLNNYMVETSKVTGVASKPLTHTGLQTLDGVQATSYCRIRYTAGDDFKRTERQREVIQELVRKAKTMEISKINDIINAVFPKIATNYSNKELLEMAPQMIGYDIADTAGFPFDRETGTISGRGSCVIPVNLAENVRQLHEFLYENYDYTPSSEVQKISEQITADTGY